MRKDCQSSAARVGSSFYSKMAVSGLRRAGAAASTAVKPIFSRDMNEAKRRVRELYRAWYREVPNTGERHRRTRGPGGGHPRSQPCGPPILPSRAEVANLSRGDSACFRGGGSPEPWWTRPGGDAGVRPAVPSIRTALQGALGALAPTSPFNS